MTHCHRPAIHGPEIGLLRRWLVFRDVDVAQAAASDPGIPADLPGRQGPIRPVEMVMEADRLDLEGSVSPIREGAVAFCYTTVEVSEARRIAIGAGADWWMEWKVNGALMFATDDGNGTGAFSIEDHRFSLDLHPGRNVVSVKVIAGRGGWQLVAAPIAALSPEADAGLRYREILASQAQYRRLTVLPFRLALPAKTLAGQVRLPAGDGPFPAIALSHGGGPQNRNGWGMRISPVIAPVEQRFLDLGFMVATWDKPGTGESTGDWRTENQSGFIECSRNLIQVVRYLRTLKECRSPVGVWGLSQGGSVGPQAAGLGNDIDFVIGASSSWTSGTAQEEYRIETTLRSMGFPEPDISAAVLATQALHGILRTARSVDEAWTEICVLADRHRQERWFFQSMLRYAHEWGLEAVKLHQAEPPGTLTPLDHLARTRCPVLLQWGQVDAVVDCHRNAALVHDLIAQHRLCNIKTITYPGCDHGLMRQGSGPLEPVEETWADIRAWLSATQKAL